MEQHRTTRDPEAGKDGCGEPGYRSSSAWDTLEAVRWVIMGIECSLWIGENPGAEWDFGKKSSFWEGSGQQVRQNAPHCCIPGYVKEERLKGCRKPEHLWITESWNSLDGKGR